MKISSCLHDAYKFLGFIFCKICLLYWKTRDYFFPPDEKYILFVAHPDDDTLFFHTFIKKYKPYVVLCTAGWSLRRLPCFFRAMRYYGVRFRAYPLHTRDQRIHILKKYIEEAISIGSFEICATHNPSGEYGHEMHVRVHNAVVSCANIPVMVPIDDSNINEFPLDKQNVLEKQFIFKNIYVTETWVLGQYSKWVYNEQLIYL